MRKGKNWTAHRLAYTEAYGPIPEGMEVRHKCDVRNCVNPDHLELGTHQDNMDDMRKRGRYSTKEASLAIAKLTPQQREEIRNARRAGILCRVLADKYNVTAATISRASR